MSILGSSGKDSQLPPPPSCKTRSCPGIQCPFLGVQAKTASFRPHPPAKHAVVLEYNVHSWEFRQRQPASAPTPLQNTQLSWNTMSILGSSGKDSQLPPPPPCKTRSCPGIQCPFLGVQAKTASFRPHPPAKHAVVLENLDLVYPAETWAHVLADSCATDATRNGGSGILLRQPGQQQVSLSLPIGTVCTNFTAEIRPSPHKLTISLLLKAIVRHSHLDRLPVQLAGCDSTRR